MAKKAAGKSGTGEGGKKDEKGRGTQETPHSMPKGGRDPKGGLTAEGRAYFAKTEGAHLRPGVQGPADTPEKMVRKGSFLRRHFANPRGPMKDDKGEPTRLALSAHAWGEDVPQTMGDAKKLAEEGHQLLEEYHTIKDGEAHAGSGQKGTPAPAKRSAKGSQKADSAKKASGPKPKAKEAAAKKAAPRKAAPRKAAPRKAAKKGATRTVKE